MYGDWQQSLCNAQVPVLERLQTAKIAFFSASVQQQTYHKEDVVIQWLTSLVKGKNASSWPEDIQEEQESVWKLLHTIFSSKRFQSLVQHQWTCPITSTFIQSVVDILGSSNLLENTQQSVIGTLHSILNYPSLKAIVINSTPLSMSLCRVLLEIVGQQDWKAILLNQNTEVTNNFNAGSGLALVKRRKVDEDRVNVDTAEGNFKSSHDMLLATLCGLIESVQQQVEVKPDREALSIYLQQVIRKVIMCRTKLTSYSGPLKSQTTKKLDAFVAACFFNAVNLPQFEFFLEQLSIEDCKFIEQESTVMTLLGLLSDIIANESLDIIRSTLFIFFKSFLEKSSKVKLHEIMLAVLLHLNGVSLPERYFFDADHCALNDIAHKSKLSSEHKEAVTCCLLSVLTSIRSSAKNCEGFLTLFIAHLCAKRPKTVNGYKSISYMAFMLSLKLGDQLPDILGHVLLWKKGDDEIIDACGSILIELMKPYSRVRQIETFIHAVAKSLYNNRSLLKSPEKFMSINKNTLKSTAECNMYPENFSKELEKSVAALEPLQYCSLLECLKSFFANELMPLIHTADSVSTGRCITAVAALCSIIIKVPLQRRMMHVFGVCKRLADVLHVYHIAILQPLTNFVSTNDDQDASLYCGLIILSRSLCYLLQRLLTKPEFITEWQKFSSQLETNDSVSKVLPLWTSERWSTLENILDKTGDKYTRYQFLMLCIETLGYFNLQSHCAGGFMQHEMLTQNEVADNKKQLTTLLLKLFKMWDIANEDLLVLLSNLRSSCPEMGKTYARCLLEVAGSDLSTKDTVNNFGVYSPAVICAILPEIISCATAVTNRKRKASNIISMGTEVESSTNNNTKKTASSFLEELSSFITQHYTEKCKEDKKHRMFIEKTKLLGQIFSEMVSNFETSFTIDVKRINEKKLTTFLELMTDIPLEFLTEDMRSLVLFVFFTIYLNYDLTVQNSCCDFIFKHIYACLRGSRRFRFIDTVDLCALIKHLVSVLSTIEQSTTDESVSNADESITGELATPQHKLLALLEVLLQRFIAEDLKIDSNMQQLTSFVVNSAKASDHEVYFLPTAWVIVSCCYKHIEDCSKSATSLRRKWCGKGIRSIGSWCLKLLHHTDRQSMTQNAAQNFLKIYTALIHLERKRAAAVEMNGVNALNKTAEGREIEDLNCTVDASEVGKVPRWQRYLSDGIELAKLCLQSEMPTLTSIALSFVTTCKLLPEKLQENLPSEVFAVALEAFIKTPQNPNKYFENCNLLKADNSSLSSRAAIAQMVNDPVTEKPISLTSLLADSSVEVYQNLLKKLIVRTTNIENSTFLHTASIWTCIISTQVPPDHAKVKRSAISVLSRNLVWHLSKPSRTHFKDDGDDFFVGLEASTMETIYELLSSIITSPDILPTQTVLQCITAASVSTEHLTVEQFSKVWQQQVMLVEQAVLRRQSTWDGCLVGLMAAIQKLIEHLVLRSDQKIAAHKRVRELLTGCTLYLERLMQNLQQFNKELSRIAHLTIAAILSALHNTVVVAPVKSVFDQIIYQFLGLCDRNALEHLPVALPPKLCSLLKFYLQNYKAHYDFKAKSFATRV